jgi:hypothetical protein
MHGNPILLCFIMANCENQMLKPFAGKGFNRFIV